MSFTVTNSEKHVDGKHVECDGGPVVLCEDGIRAKCGNCGKEEMWEEAARRLSEACSEFYKRAMYFEDVEKRMREHVHALGFGYLLNAGIPFIGDAKVEGRRP